MFKREKNIFKRSFKFVFFFFNIMKLIELMHCKCCQKRNLINKNQISENYFLFISFFYVLKLIFKTLIMRKVGRIIQGQKKIQIQVQGSPVSPGANQSWMRNSGFIWKDGFEKRVRKSIQFILQYGVQTKLNFDKNK